MSKPNITLNQIAQKAGVSTATVSRVINNKQGVNLLMRNQVEQAIQELNYIPKKQKISNAANNSASLRIGFLAADLLDETYMYLLKGVLQVSRSHNFEITLYESGHSAENEVICLKQMQANALDGIIAVISHEELNSEYQNLISQHFPLVFIVNPEKLTEWPRDDVNVVTCDAVEGAFFATKYLIDLGHKDIVYLGRTKTSHFIGYQKALNEAGIPLNPDIIIDSDSSFEDTYSIITNIVTGSGLKFSAIVAENDRAAIGCWRALNNMGYRVPEDCSVIGSDNEKIAACFSLTTIAEPLMEIGKNAVYLLHECLGGFQAKPRIMLLRDSLIIRNSCSKKL